MRNFKPDAKGPLDGLRILDMTRVVAGNELTVLLADYGADVIKIETPGKGDDLRNWKTEGISTHWKVYSRNKRSLTLNLRDDKAKELFVKLVATRRRPGRELPPRYPWRRWASVPISSTRSIPSW